ncbi:MAG: 4-hydroxy-tetrahydrodipicolinate reductase [Coriobacteriales bacterium]|nr:4-hydroxy-tetrahydrodipicolinate reductase [Coriobacteriales bacterium]
MIRVVVSGAKGRMGTQVVEAVSKAEDLKLVGCYAPLNEGEHIVCADGDFVCSANLDALLDEVKPDVMVDFSLPKVARGNVECALKHGVHVVLGTTGTSAEDLKDSWERCSCNGAHLFVAPNFTTGAVLMMQFAKLAAEFFDDIEIIELHHNGKADAPSGTAVQTARMMAQARKGKKNIGPGSETEMEGFKGARGTEVEGIRVHSVRGDGYMASQEIIMSTPGQILTIRHDSTQRTSYMPGVLLAIRSVMSLEEGFVIGLDKLMGLA